MYGLVADQGANLAAMLCVFLATPLLIRHLGQTDFGFWMTVMQLLGYIGLIDPGLGLQITRAVAGHEEPVKLREFLATAFYAQLGFALLFLIAGVCLGLALVHTVNPPPGAERAYRATYLLAVGVGAVGVVSGYFVAILAGRQRLVATGIIGCLQQTVGLAAGTVAASWGMGLLALPVAYLGVAILALVVAVGLARRHETRGSLRLADARLDNLPALAGFSAYFQMTKAAFIVLTSAPSLVIAAMLGTAAVTAYVVTTRLALTCGALVARAANVLYPGIAELMARKDYAALRRVMINMQYTSARIGCWMALGILVVNETFVRLWVGPDLYGGLLLTLAVCGMIVRDTIVRSLGVFIIADGNMRGLGWLSLVEAGCTLGLIWFFTRQFGVGGAALGALVSTSCIISPYVVWRVGRILDISPGRLLWLGTGRALLHSLPPAVGLVALAWVLPHSWGWGWLITVGVAAVLLNVAMFDLPVLWRTRGAPWPGRLRILLEAR